MPARREQPTPDGPSLPVFSENGVTGRPLFQHMPTRAETSKLTAELSLDPLKQLDGLLAAQLHALLQRRRRLTRNPELALRAQFRCENSLRRGLRTNRWIIDTLRLQAQRENLTADLYRTTAELTRREAILQVMANHDQLTGLFNRYYLLETLGRELARATRLHVPITVAILDIDHFKDYNGNFGHEAGDEVLREIGTMLKNAVRASDIVFRAAPEVRSSSLSFSIVPLRRHASAEPHILDVKQHQYVYRGKPLPSVTLSVGSPNIRIMGAASMV